MRSTHRGERVCDLCSFGVLTGHYWVDPNGGCVDDVVEVFCNFTGGLAKTCVLPQRAEAERKAWSGDSLWFSSLQGGFQVTSGCDPGALPLAARLRLSSTSTFKISSLAAVVRHPQVAAGVPKNRLTCGDAILHLPLPPFHCRCHLPYPGRQGDRSKQNHPRWMPSELYS